MDTSPIREVKRRWLKQLVERHGGSQRQFAADVGIDHTNLNGMLQGQRTVSDDTVDLIHRTLGVALPISEYAQKSAAPSGMPLAVTVDRDGEENIVCVEAKAKAGYVNGLGDPVYLSKLPAYRLPYLSSGTFRDFAVDGYSMFNPETGQIAPNAHVVARFITHQEIRSSRVHVVVTDSDILIKRVYPEDHHLRLTSDNPDKIAFPDIEIPVAMVREVWYVERLISASIPPRSSHDEVESLRSELDAFRKALSLLERKVH